MKTYRVLAVEQRINPVTEEQGTLLLLAKSKAEILRRMRREAPSTRVVAITEVTP